MGGAEATSRGAEAQSGLRIMDDPTILSVDTVLRKTKANSLTEVRNINLWGCKLANLQVLKQMPAVEIISLSVNNISTLADFACCSNLKELYLRKNAISDLNEVLFLKDLPNLKVLWLCDNPITELPHYRDFVVRCCPGLSKLDNADLTPDEIASAKSAFPDLDQISLQMKVVDGPRSPARPQSAVAGQAKSPTSPSFHSPSSPAAAAPQVAAASNVSESKRENVVKAIMFLLDELDQTGLQSVQSCIEAKLQNQ